jgi:hypothetical protein
MKAIKLSCKTAGFQFGDIAEVGSEEGQIDAKTAKGLVNDGLAVEVKEKVASSGNSDKVITKLKSEVETLTEANTVLKGKVETLTEGGDEALKARIAELEGYVEVAINLQKGKIPDGYKKG